MANAPKTWSDVAYNVTLLFAHIMRKALSVRVIVTLMVSATLCVAVFKCFDLILATIKDKEQYTMIKDVVMFMFGSFTTLVSVSTATYFNRTDRWRTQKQDGEETNGGTENEEKK